MSAQTQIANLDTVTSLAGMVHEVYLKDVRPHVAFLDPVAGIFKSRVEGRDYSLTGSKLVGSARLTYSMSAQGTNGYIPEPSSSDLARWETTAARMYLRKQFDDYMLERIKGPGAFESLAEHTAKEALDDWRRMTARHIHGSAAATLCTVGSRVSATSFIFKNGYGHPGTTPTLFLESGVRVAILDESNGYAVLGAGKIATVNHQTGAVTFSGSMETLGGGNTVAADDPVVMIGSTDSTSGPFVNERGYAPLGLRDHLDPDAVNTSYLGISEVTQPRWKPIRRTSTDFTEVEMMAFRMQVGANGGMDVNESSHVATTHPAVIFEMAKTLIGFTQIHQKGKVLNGGWESVKIAGYDVVESGYHTHDELMLHHLPDYCVGVLGEGSSDGVKARPDGNVMSRLVDFDGHEWYMKAYLQRWMIQRNRSGTLKGIAVDAANVLGFGPTPQ